MSELSLTKLENGLLSLAFSSGSFTASAVISQTHLLEPFAASLKGFPASLSQVAEFRQEPDTAQGDSVHLKLFCIDDGGHIAAELTVESPIYLKGNVRKNSVRLFMATEPIFVAKFHNQLKKLLGNDASSATLNGADS